MAAGLSGLSWNQNGTSIWVSSFLLSFTSASSQETDLLSGAFTAGVAQTAPQETSVVLSCNNLIQGQLLQEAVVHQSFSSSLVFCFFSCGGGVVGGGERV